MEAPKIMKTIIPDKCPHCAKDIYIGYQTMIPSLTKISTPEEVKEAKDDVKKKIEEIKFSNDTSKASIIKWIDEPNTLIDHSDVEEILKQIILDQKQDETKSDKN